MKTMIAPSILSADFSEMGAAIEKIEKRERIWSTATLWTAFSFPISRSDRK